MWSLRAATAMSTAQSTHPLATLPRPTSETRSSTHRRLIAPTTPINSRTCFGQPAPLILDAARPHVPLTTPTYLLVLWLRIANSSTPMSSKAMERMQGSTALSTSKPSLRRPQLAQALLSLVLPTLMGTPTPSPMPLRLVVLLSLVRLPQLRESLVLLLTKDFAPRC